MDFGNAAGERPGLLAQPNENGRGPAMFVSAALGVSIAAAFGAPASAQDQDAVRDLGEIIVNGQRFERAVQSPKATAPVLDAPQTVAVIPVQVFEQQGARNLTDVLQNTPGITFNAGENGFTTGLSSFGVRGFDVSDSIFIDDVRDAGSYTRDVFNVEQVEVFKGATGDNGRSGPGGYVNLATKTPTARQFLDTAVSYGFDEYDSDERVRVTLDANQPFSATVAGRLNLVFEDGGVPGRAVAERGTWGIAPSMAFGLGTPTRLIVSAQHVEQDDVPDWGLPGPFIDGLPGFDPAVDGEGLRDVFYGLSSDFDEVTSDIVLARVEHNIRPDMVLSSQLRFANTDREAAYTLPTGYTPATQSVTTQLQSFARENRSLAFTNNLSAAFTTGGLRHRLSAGVEFTRDEATAAAFPAVTNPGTGAPVPAADPNPDRAGRILVQPTQFSDVEVDTVAAYLFDTIELSPQWEITGGLRLEQYDVGISARTAAGAPIAADGLEIDRFNTSGRLGVVYKPTQNASLYASAGVSALPPASFLSTTDISREGDNAFPGFSAGINSEDAETQKSVNYEIGGKWNLMGGNLLATAALFRTEKQDVAITGRPTPTDPVELLGYGEQIAQGLELGLSGRITPQWTVFAGALFLETERQHSAELDLGRCRANPADYGVATAAACGPTNRTSGDSLAFTPDVSANIWTTYEFPFRLTVGGGVRYVGDSFIGRPDTAERFIPNDDARKVPDYWVANVMAEYEINPTVAVRLNVENITDEFYAVSTNWPASRASIGNPRSALLSLRLKL